MTSTSTTASTMLRVYLDSTTVLYEAELPRIMSAGDYMNMDGFVTTSLSAESHTITLQYHSNGSATATIQYAYLDMWRVS